MSDDKGRPIIVGVGEILWDLLPGGKQLGGAAANFAWHAAALGAVGTVVSRVGDDELGREILARLDTMTLDRSGVSIDATHPTGTVAVRLSPEGVPDYEIRTDVAWDFLAFTTELAELAARADAVCFGTLGQRAPASREAIGRFLASLRPNCLRIFDVNLRQNYYDRGLIHDMLMQSDVLKLNDTELPVLANMFGILGEGSVAVQNLMSRYPLKLVALTLGPGGSRLQGIGESSRHPGFAPFPTATLETSDTVGAGDAFTAALAIGLLRQLPLQQINNMANRVASYVCSQPGATPPNPTDLLDQLAMAQ